MTDFGRQWAQRTCPAANTSALPGVRAPSQPTVVEAQTPITHKRALGAGVLVGRGEDAKGKAAFFGHRWPTLEPLWEFPFREGTAIEPSLFVCLRDEELVVGDVRLAKLERRELTSGERLELCALPEKLGGYAVAGDRLIGVDKKERHLHGFRLDAPLGEALWQLPTRGPMLAAAPGVVVESASGTLRGLSPDDGRERWRLKASKLGSIRGIDGRGLLLGHFSSVTELDPETGETRWSWSPGESRLAMWDLGPSAALVLRHDKRTTRTETATGVSISTVVTAVLAGISRRTGELLFEQPMEDGDEVLATGFAADVVYVALKRAGATWLHAFDAESGERLYQLELELPPLGLTLIPGEGQLEVVFHASSRTIAGGQDLPAGQFTIATLRG